MDRDQRGFRKGELGLYARHSRPCTIRSLLDAYGGIRDTPRTRRRTEWADAMSSPLHFARRARSLSGRRLLGFFARRSGQPQARGLCRARRRIGTKSVTRRLVAPLARRLPEAVSHREFARTA